MWWVYIKESEFAVAQHEFKIKVACKIYILYTNTHVFVCMCVFLLHFPCFPVIFHENCIWKVFVDHCTNIFMYTQSRTHSPTPHTHISAYSIKKMSLTGINWLAMRWHEKLWLGCSQKSSLLTDFPWHLSRLKWVWTFLKNISNNHFYFSLTWYFHLTDRWCFLNQVTHLPFSQGQPRQPRPIK